MYKNYKANLQKQKKQQVKEVKKESARPEWNSSLFDDDRFKLTPAELISKKVSLISKHKVEAKSLWQTRQEKLKKGIIDEETLKVIETAKDSKNLNSNKYQYVRRNLSQMIHFMDSKCSDEEDESLNEENYNQNEQHQQQLIEENDEFSDKENNNNNKKRQNIEQNQIEVSNQDPQALFAASQSSVNSRFTDIQGNNQLLQSQNSYTQESDFMKEVEKNLRNTRDFLNDLEKCNCKEKDPCKVLKAMENVQIKEQRRSSINNTLGNTQGKSKTSSQNLQQSQKQLSNCGDSSCKKSVKNKNNDNNFLKKKKQGKSKKESDLLKQENKENIIPDQKNIEQDLEVADYFKSLNKIEDTIKFMENNICNNKQNNEDKFDKINSFKDQKIEENMINEETNIGKNNLSQKSIPPLSQKPKSQDQVNEEKQQQQQQQSINDGQQNNSLNNNKELNQKQKNLLFNKNEFAISPQKEEYRDYNNELNKFLEDEEKAGTHEQGYYVNSNNRSGLMNSHQRRNSQDNSNQNNDNDAISFTLTARSTDNSQLISDINRTSNISQIKGSSVANNIQTLSPSKFFNQTEADNINKKKVRFNDIPSQEELKQQSKLEIQQQQLVDDNYSQQRKNVQQQSNKNNVQQQNEQVNENEDDELFNLDYVKTMLENTKKDLDKMNQSSFDFPHISLGGFGTKNSIDLQQQSQKLDIKQLSQNFVVKTNPSQHDVQVISSQQQQQKPIQIEKQTYQEVDEMESMPMPRSLGVIQQNCLKQTVQNFGKNRINKENSLCIRDHINQQ